MSAAWTFPWSWYADPEVLRLEQEERIFRRTWQYVGHAGRVEGLGDRFSAWAGKVPVLVTSSATTARSRTRASARPTTSTRTSTGWSRSPSTSSRSSRTRARRGRGTRRSTSCGRTSGSTSFAGAPNLSLGPLLPAGPERSTGFLDYFFAPGADPGWLDELLAFDRQVGAGDRVLVERVQKGVRSGVVQEWRLLGESEQIAPPETRILPG